MKAIHMKSVLALMVVVAMNLASETTEAQCTTCAVPQVTYSPVVYNTVTYDDRWYLGKYIGRMGRRIFGTAPAPAVTYTGASYSAPTTFAASYAPTYSYASYAPTSSSCCSSSCNCQTTFRPVIMQPVAGCTSCNACDSCSTGVVQTTFEAPLNTGCASCASGTSTIISSEPAPSLNNNPGSINPAPSLNSPAPPSTYRENVEPTPADQTSTETSPSDLDAPLLLNPSDQMTKLPTAPVWTAVYKQPAKISTVNTEETSSKPRRLTMGWSSGR